MREKEFRLSSVSMQALDNGQKNGPVLSPSLARQTDKYGRSAVEKPGQKITLGPPRSNTYTLRFARRGKKYSSVFARRVGE